MISAGLAARRLFFGWRRRQTIPAGGCGASRRLRGLAGWVRQRTDPDHPSVLPRCICAVCCAIVVCCCGVLCCAVLCAVLLMCCC